MTRAPTDGEPRSVADVAMRLFGSVFLVGGVVLLALAFLVTRFPPVQRDGMLAYLLPGTAGHSIEAQAVAVLGLAALALLGLSAVSFVFSGWRRLRAGPERGLRPSRPSRPSRRLRSRLILIVGCLVLLVVVAIRFAVGRHPPESSGITVTAPLSQR